MRDAILAAAEDLLAQARTHTLPSVDEIAAVVGIRAEHLRDYYTGPDPAAAIYCDLAERGAFLRAPA